MHCNPTQFLYAFFGGVMFSYAAIKSGSVFYGIVLHFTNNLLSFIYLIIDKYMAKDISSLIISYSDVFFIIAGLWSLIYLSTNMFFKTNDENKSNVSPIKYTFSAYTIIYLLYALYLTSRWFYII